ncbi:MAG: glutathione S-transferase N-terminal domain-containing protein [Pseudomonadota bacterium]
MKLYFSPTSPFVRKVMLVLYLRNLVGQVQLITAAGTPLEPNKLVVGANPVGKIPALETDSGAVLADSKVITRYLDKLSGGGLYPSDDSEFAVLTRESMADAIMEAGILAVYETRLRPEAHRLSNMIDAYTSKITRMVKAFEAEADAITKEPVTIDQIALACAFGYLDFRFPGLPWRGDAPKVAAWFDEYRETPAMLHTAPKG